MFQGGNIRGAGGWDADKCSRTLSPGSQAHFMGAICELKGFSSPVSSPVDCQLGGWKTAGACSATCGGGVQENTRNVTTEASHGGKACGARSMSLPCNEQPCVEETEILECGPGFPQEEGVFYSGNDIAKHKPVASGDACSEMC